MSRSWPRILPCHLFATTFFRFFRSPAAIWARVTGTSVVKMVCDCRCMGRILRVTMTLCPGKLVARRLSFLVPADSLLLQKPRMVVPHQGGRRIEKGSWEFQILHDWIAAGAPNDTHDAPELVHPNSSPSRITVYAPENSVTLRVRATLSNGAVRNATSLANCRYLSRTRTRLQMGPSRRGRLPAFWVGRTILCLYRMTPMIRSLNCRS